MHAASLNELAKVCWVFSFDKYDFCAYNVIFPWEQTYEFKITAIYESIKGSNMRSNMESVLVNWLISPVWADFKLNYQPKD